MILSDLVEFRGPTASDYNFILSSWLRSARSCHNGHVNRLFFDERRGYKRFVSDVLEWPDIQCKVICLKKDIQHIVGWSVYSDDALHYVYIKQVFRGNRFSRAIIPNLDPFVVTSISDSFKRLAQREGIKYTYFPYLRGKDEFLDESEINLDQKRWGS